MSADWEVGDLALCVKMGPWIGETSGRLCEQQQRVRGGGVYTVRLVGPSKAGATSLWFEGVGETDKFRDGFLASCFRKITPPAADEFDRETIEMGKRAPVGEPA